MKTANQKARLCSLSLPMAVLLVSAGCGELHLTSKRSASSPTDPRGSSLIDATVTSETPPPRCAVAVPPVKSFIQHPKPREAWANFVRTPTLRGMSSGSCDATKSHCLTAVSATGSTITFSEIAVAKAALPRTNPALSDATINFPTGVETETFKAIPCSRPSPDGRDSWCNATALFRELTAKLKSKDYQGRRVRVNVADAWYIFDTPATSADLQRPSLELHGLKDVDIVGQGKPRLIFANTRSHGIEISGCERVALRNLFLDYDFKADFSAVAGAPDGFQVSPYFSSF